MKIIRFNQVLKDYLEKMIKLHQQENSPGINDYLLVLKDFLYSSLEFCREKISQENIEIEIHKNPGEFQMNFPAVRLGDGKTEVYGYIDVLPPNTAAEEISSYHFINLYKRVLPNLILTNFFEFRYYRREQKVCTARPFSASHLEPLSNKPKVISKKLFLKELQYFMRCSDNKSIASVPSFLHLQQQLALKTYYLKEYILTPLLNHLVLKGIKDELYRIYRAYCYFFNQDLTIKEFSAFLTHVIIDGFFRAGIFYNNLNSNPGMPLSRCRVYQFARSNRIPTRRLAIFNYLSSGSGETQLPDAVKWFLDEVCVFLAHIDFKQMCCFPWKNPMLIDGEMLQLEGYFFKPYYDKEEAQIVRHLLKKEGIFSCVINLDRQKKMARSKKKSRGR